MVGALGFLLVLHHETITSNDLFFVVDAMGIAGVSAD